jgi:hypothetical protein
MVLTFVSQVNQFYAQNCIISFSIHLEEECIEHHIEVHFAVDGFRAVRMSKKSLLSQQLIHSTI